MDAIEFVSNYPKYVKEIRSVVKDNLQLLIGELEAKDTHDLVTPDTWFPNESAARGFVWGMFIDAVNKYSYQTITIDIQEINNL